MNLYKNLSILACVLLVMNMSLYARGKKKSIDKENTHTTNTIKSLSLEAAFVDAMQAKVLGNTTEAISKFLSILKTDPTIAEAHFQLSQIYYAQGQIEKAEIANKRAVELNPNDEWYYIYLEQILSRKGDYEGAANTFGAYLNLKPDDIDSYYYYALLLERAKRYRDAIAAYKKIESVEGINHDILAKKLPLYDKLGDKKGALLEINNLLDEYPNEYKYLGYLGAFYEVNEEFDKAEETYKEIIDKAKSDIFGYYLLSELYDNMDDLDKENNIIDETVHSTDIKVEDKKDFLVAIFQSEMKYPKPRNIDKIISAIEYVHGEYPDNKEMTNLLINAYTSADQNDKAIELAKENLSDTSGSIQKDSYIKLLSVIANSDDNDELFDYAVKGGKLFPEDPIFDFFAAASSMMSKNHARAQIYYKSGLEKEFTNEQLKLQMWIGLGDASSELKDDDEADKAYEKALELDPNDASALNNYAYFLSVRNIDLQKAEKMSRKSNLLEDKNAAFQDTYAWIQYMKGEYFDALMWMEKAMESAGGHPSFDMYDHYGDILYKLDRKDEAIKYWNLALGLDENNEAVKEKIQKAEK